LAFNTDWAVRLAPDRLLELFKDYITVNAAVGSSASAGPTPFVGSTFQSVIGRADDTTLAKVLESCKGFRTFADVIRKAGFLFVADDSIEYDPKAVMKVLAKNDGEGFRMLEYLLPQLGELSDWSPTGLKSFFHAVCGEKGVNLGKVAQPVRVAVSGTTISPSIEDTLVLLGKDHTMSRIERCAAQQR